MRRVLLWNMLSTGFNNRWGGLFTGDIVTEERVSTGAIPIASGSIYIDHERLLQGQSSYLLTRRSAVRVQALLWAQVVNLCHRCPLLPI
jgi:hypothetical protein